MKPYHIIGRVYVGNDESFEKVRDDEDWYSIRCCKYGPGGHKDLLGYTTKGAPDGPNKYWVEKGRIFAINLLDLDDPNFVPKSAVFRALKYAKKELDAGKHLLFACNEGESRGPTVALMFLRSIGEMPYSFSKAHKIYKTLYPRYDPGIGILQAAKNWWYELNRLNITESDVLK